MHGPSAAWVKANCTNPKLVQDVLQFISDANAAGVHCWFLIGGGLIRSGTASLVHCFLDEVFVFQLTDAQAAMQGIDRRGTCLSRGRDSLPEMQPPAKIAISLERLELQNTEISQTMPLIGRVHYEVLAGPDIACCVQMIYEMGKQHRQAWDYPKQPLSGKGSLDFSFLPIVTSPSMVTDFKGPMAVFVRLCALAAPQQPEACHAISNAVASLVEVV